MFSYTQLSQYIACPRRYRYRYIERWQERDSRAATLFGRVFESALEAHFRGGDAIRTFESAWDGYQDVPLSFGRSGSWGEMLEEGVLLLRLFLQDARIHVPSPADNLQIKIIKSLRSGQQFVAKLDAIGFLDGQRCVIEWKTTGQRCPDGPSGLLSLDPQLLCYSWASGIDRVAMIIFVRKRAPEIQYLQTIIDDQQRQEFEELVENTVERIGNWEFLPHSGIRFPQNGCVKCPYLGLCTGDAGLIRSRLVEPVKGHHGLSYALHDRNCTDGFHAR